jgi:hypothetical protein
MRKFLVLLLILAACSSSPYPHRLAICAIFKNEAPWMEEWLVYHRDVLGVTRFYLYNNDSTDNFREVLEPFIQEGIVELIEWDSSDPNHIVQGAFMDVPWAGAQIGAYNDCLKNRALGQAKWVAMIDIDEFIVPVNGVKAFYKLLNRAEDHKKGTVSMHWRVFGTSEVEDLAEGELLTEKLTWRANDDHPWNILVKSIHRPEAIDFCLIHIAEKLKPNYGAKTFKPEEARIHHYWARTEKFSLGKRSKCTKTHPEFFEVLNKIEDQTIHQYLPLMKHSE